MPNPNYVHDCSRCIFLGSFTYMARYHKDRKSQTADLYYCPNKIDGSCIARFSSIGSDYSSFSSSIVKSNMSTWMSWADEEAESTASPALIEAYKRAVTSNLL